MKTLRLIACFALVSLVFAPSQADAYWPMYGSAAGFGGVGYGGFGGAGFYGPWYGALHSAAYSPPPPYYSIHPPVYYSPTIVRRSYGWSPYAYGPYPPVAAQAPVIEQPAPEPLLVVNPYVAQKDDLPAPTK